MSDLHRKQLEAWVHWKRREKDCTDEDFVSDIELILDDIKRLEKENQELKERLNNVHKCCNKEMVKIKEDTEINGVKIKNLTRYECKVCGKDLMDENNSKRVFLELLRAENQELRRENKHLLDVIRR